MVLHHKIKLENMETHHMMGIHHVENSDKNESTFTFLNTLLFSKFAVAQFMRSESDKEKNQVIFLIRIRGIF